MYFLRSIAAAFFLLFALPASANIVTTERTESTLLSEVKSIHAGQKFWVMVQIKMQPGWHTYWKNPGDSGTPPSLAWTMPKGFTASEVRFMAPERQKTGPLVDYGYSDNAYFLFEIAPPAILRDNTTSILALRGEWLVCKEVCVPERAELSIALPATDALQGEASDDAALVHELVAKLATPLAQPVGFSAGAGEVRFAVALKDIGSPSVQTAQFFPAMEGLITNASDPRVTVSPEKISFAYKAAEGTLPEKADGLISVFLQNGQRKDFDAHLQLRASDVTLENKMSDASDSGKVATAMLFAFLGGVLLNLMPCVFPILSLKALAIAKKSAAHPEQVRAQGMAYAAGVVLSFITLALLLIAVQAGGTLAGWGYQMQSPGFVAVLAFLLFAVGLNLSGYFELPVLFGSVGSKKIAKDNLLASFLTGALAVVVATPCTAPFMAPAIGFALTQSIAVILIVFASLGVGMAVPFLLISLFPKLTQMLPRPGSWMHRFKQCIAFPIYLSVVWLLWVLAREGGADAVGAALLAMVLIVFALWLGQQGRRAVKLVGALLAAAAIAGTVVFLAGVKADVKNNFHAHAIAFSSAALESLRAQGQPVFVDATADWCLTCKLNERLALSSDDVAKAFADKQVAVMIADWTKGDADITRYLSSFGRSGVPLYVYYPGGDAEPRVLPQLLTSSLVIKAIQP